MASTEQKAAAVKFGLRNVPIIEAAAHEAGLPFHVACALMEMESNGRNVYGHDHGGALSGFPGEVNRDNFAVFEWLVFTRGQTSNGVGPCQITWRGFFPDMKAKGLDPWDPRDNMLYGFRLLMSHHIARKTWQGAGTAYNGGADYGRTFARRVGEWQRRLDV